MDLQAMASSVGLAGLAPDVARAVAASPVMPVHAMLCGLCDSMGARFVKSGSPVSAAQVFAPSALLPALAWMSQDAGKRLLDADFGCVLIKPAANEETALGATCSVPPVTGHIADMTRAMFFAHYSVELFGLRQGALIEVMPLQEVLRPVFEDHLGSVVMEGEAAWPQMSPTI